jgi:hypothetical protein
MPIEVNGRVLSGHRNTTYLTSLSHHSLSNIPE